MGTMDEKWLQRNPELLATEVDGEVMMLDIPSERYFAMNKVGSVIWDFFNKPKTISALYETLAARYGIDEATYDSDVTPFLDELVQKGLLQSCGETVSS